jgi:hypothetical protein
MARSAGGPKLESVIDPLGAGQQEAGWTFWHMNDSPCGKLGIRRATGRSELLLRLKFNDMSSILSES